MESPSIMNPSPSSSSLFKSFKSKKILKPNDPKSSGPNPPNKPMQPRSRNEVVVSSLNEIKKIAIALNQSNRAKPSNELDSPKSTKKTKNPTNKANPTISLPERYELLAEFFEKIQLTVRLFKMRMQKTSFINMSPCFRDLTDKELCYKYLAQMKYILPEAVEFKKYIVVDENTRCTKSDFEVNLLPDVIKIVEKVDDAHSNLRKVFRVRLLEFVNAHPEEDEIPLGELPEPFNMKLQNSILSLKKQSHIPLPVHSSSDTLPQQSLVAASLLPPSFKTRFTQKAPISESERTHLSCINLSSAGQSVEVRLNSRAIDNKPLVGVAPVGSTLPKSVEIGNKEAVAVKNKDCSLEENLHSVGTPAKLTSTLQPCSTPTRTIELSSEEVDLTKNNDCLVKEAHFEGTPAKLISTPARLMASTPAMQTPKRCHIIQDTACTPSPKLVRRPPKRPLFNTPIKNRKSEEKINDTEISSSAYVMNFLPAPLQSSLIEKEKKVTKELDIAISQAKRRKQMIAHLPKLFDMIRYMFQSVRNCVITKEDLMSKLLRVYLDIVDRAELEEQLVLLKELVPELIQENLRSSGDLLLCINKRCSPDSVHKILTEAS